ncbi:hypothetical protein FHS18_004290 [Paenibacillus phyllosphaerae]|uniref:DUF3221 domain-containing protein n=1 Tax=Paenibacillus phyllosphaerae TaxID=274593 RepID=A0A7W5B0K2_9BACL|nr:hypothetical protein [Paenibacillus phyllosphaerae]MBB3112204.1 hypothetical protein [Paenibacillus phyllosphaerae]
MKTKWKVVIGVVAALLIFAIFIKLSSTTLTVEYATIVKKASDSISLVNEGGRPVEVTTSIDFSDLIEVGQKYWVRYEQKSWGPPYLLSIEK